jgi:hypothetical protein
LYEKVTGLKFIKDGTVDVLQRIEQNIVAAL